MMRSLLWKVAISVVFIASALAAPADPEPGIYVQPDGLATPALYMEGDEHFSWMTDDEGYTVLKDNHGFCHYAEKRNDGRLVASKTRVGFGEPKALGLVKSLMPDNDKLPDNALKPIDVPKKKKDAKIPTKTPTQGGVRARDRKLWHAPTAPLCVYSGTPSNPCVVKHLVVLVRFADHATRVLPDRSAYETLFNDDASESVKDYFLANSYGSLILDTHVTDWVQVSKTEEHAVANEFDPVTNETIVYQVETEEKRERHGERPSTFLNLKDSNSPSLMMMAINILML
jgi:hypothetical protein